MSLSMCIIDINIQFIYHFNNLEEIFVFLRLGFDGSNGFFAESNLDLEVVLGVFKPELTFMVLLSFISRRGKGVYKPGTTNLLFF